MTDSVIDRIVAAVLSEMEQQSPGMSVCDPVSIQEPEENGTDLADQSPRDVMNVPNPRNLDGLLQLKRKTPARLGIWRTGCRYTTGTYLKFRGDHALARDSVFSDVAEDFLQSMELFPVKTRCSGREEFLTRPDLGALFDEENRRLILERCIREPTVQVYAADGLSSSAVTANLRDLLPAILQGLAFHRLDAGTPFFVKYGRVRTMDHIAQMLSAQVVCVLIGERPGLATAESLSAYIAYRPEPGMPESNRTVVSNIHRGGTPVVEAGAYIADIIRDMLTYRCSGVPLRLAMGKEAGQ